MKKKTTYRSTSESAQEMWKTGRNCRYEIRFEKDPQIKIERPEKGE